MNARTSMTSEEAQEIRMLRAEYFDASKRAAEAIQTGEHPFDAIALDALITADAQAGKAMRRIKELYGVLNADNEMVSLIKLPNPQGEIQPEVPKIGSSDALGG
jgi:hypothetical protein